MATMKEYKERRAMGATIVFYYEMFVVFILIPLLLVYAIFR